MEEFLKQYGYIALMAGTFLEGETAILVASSLIQKGLFHPPYMLFFGFAGSFASDWLYYLIGRLNGRYFLSRRPAFNQKVQPVKTFFEHNKVQILLSYRFLYGFRTIIPIVIGMSAVKPVQFLFFSVISGLLWAAVLSTFGYTLGRFFQIDAPAFERNFLLIVLCCAAFGVLTGYVIKKLTFRKMETNPN